MADTKISALTNYTAPIGADIIPIVDTTNSLTKGVTLQTLNALYNNTNVASQATGFASDTYLVGSSLSIPAGGPYVSTMYECFFDVSKTAAGTATPIITLRIGTAGSIADTAINTFTFTAGTAAIDVGVFHIYATFRTVGSGTSAVLQGTCTLNHNLAATGLVNLNGPTLQSTSSGFNSTTANTIIGLSVNGGASAVWTVQNVQSQLIL